MAFKGEEAELEQELRGNLSPRCYVGQHRKQPLQVLGIVRKLLASSQQVPGTTVGSPCPPQSCRCWLPAPQRVDAVWDARS